VTYLLGRQGIELAGHPGDFLCRFGIAGAAVQPIAARGSCSHTGIRSVPDAVLGGLLVWDGAYARYGLGFPVN